MTSTLLTSPSRSPGVVIDRATRWVSFRTYRNQSEASSTALLRRLKGVAPMVIRKVLTDNGSQFTDRFTSAGKRPLQRANQRSGRANKVLLSRRVGDDPEALPLDLQPQHPSARLASSNPNSGAQGLARKEAYVVR